MTGRVYVGKPQSRKSLPAPVRETLKEAEPEKTATEPADTSKAIPSPAHKDRQAALPQQLDVSSLEDLPLLGWRPPTRYSAIPERRFDRLRRMKGILVEGESIPPPVPLFSEMRLPRAMLDYLHGVKRIRDPSPIQMQGLPVALLGRDLIGIAFTGSGKSLVFMLPVVLYALECEAKMPLVAGEGPLSLILAPSRELARQTHQNLQEMVKHVTSGLPYRIQVLLAIGGTGIRDIFKDIDQHRGIHIVVATTGRLLDLLGRERLSLAQCRQLVMDEADRMIDLGFEEEVRAVIANFCLPRQTLLFSATMPKSIREFVVAFLRQPVMVNVGRAGAASMDIIQEIEWVEDRKSALLVALQKTGPPVLIFAANKAEVDDIHEHLLRRQIEAVAIHGGLSQDERSYAIDAFKAGKRDVLVATDVASKGLDFPAIQHVINWDMPSEIEDYVHRIGRTGRGGRTGIATTFISGRDSESILRDLTQLLREAKQAIPSFLAPFNVASDEACPVCGGLGHGQPACPKLDLMAMKQSGRPRFGGDAF